MSLSNGNTSALDYRRGYELNPAKTNVALLNSSSLKALTLKFTQ